MEKLIVLGTGNASVTKCYNTCSIIQDKKGRLQSRRNGTAWILLAAAVWLLLLIFIVYPIFIWKNPVLIAIFIPFFIALVPVYIVITSRKSYRLKMDEKGCIRKFLFLSKRYPWKDLLVKLVASEESHCGEGVLFIKKKSGNSSSASETFSYASLHPPMQPVLLANFSIGNALIGKGIFWYNLFRPFLNNNFSY